jgi:hypothetical protein
VDLYRNGHGGDCCSRNALSGVRSVYPFRYSEEDFQERAAIIEYCGNETREAAEELAIEQFQEQQGLQNLWREG